jgi:hypothetical protein
MRRKDEAYGFDYSPAIVDLVTHYLFEKPPDRQLGKLGDDELWGQFEDDCDLHGTDLDVWLNDQ